MFTPSLPNCVIRAEDVPPVPVPRPRFDPKCQCIGIEIQVDRAAVPHGWVCRSCGFSLQSTPGRCPSPTILSS